MSGGSGARAFALTFVAAATAGALGWLSWRSFYPSSVPTPRAAAAGAAGAAIVAGAPQSGPGSLVRAIPEQLPDFELATAEGPPRRLASFQHPILVLNFWATWCEPCRREIPLLIAARRERARDGVEVVGIAVDFREAVLKYARQVGIDYPLLIGEQDGLAAADQFGIEFVLPFTVVADAKRRIVALKIGELHRNELQPILDQAAALNAGTVSIEVARRTVAEVLRARAAERRSAAGTASNLP